jgi:hypothetical protein
LPASMLPTLSDRRWAHRTAPGHHAASRLLNRRWISRRGRRRRRRRGNLVGRSRLQVSPRLQVGPWLRINRGRLRIIGGGRLRITRCGLHVNRTGLGIHRSRLHIDWSRGHIHWGGPQIDRRRSNVDLIWVGMMVGVGVVIARQADANPHAHSGLGGSPRKTHRQQGSQQQSFSSPHRRFSRAQHAFAASCPSGPTPKCESYHPPGNREIPFPGSEAC